MKFDHLKEKLKHLPDQPGIYMMKDFRGDIVYVGKAKVLRNRVRSYFVGIDSKDLKTKGLIAQINDFDIIITKSEQEALLLERTLIRHHHPRYNVMLKDGKEYPYLRIDFQEDWPRIEKVRRRQQDRAFYLGPFSNAGSLNTTLKLMGQIFPSIRCTRYEFKNAKRPCNYYHMKMCLGPCTLPIDRDVHIQTLRDSIAFLMGRNQELTRDLKQKMSTAANAEKFELAAQLRDQLFALEEISKRQTVVIKELNDGDVVGFSMTDGVAGFSVLMIREGRLIGNDTFVLNSPLENQNETMQSFLLQYYDQRIAPPEILLPFTLDDAEIVAQTLGPQDLDIAERTPPKISVPQRGPKHNLLDMAKTNATYALEEHQRSRNKNQVELEFVQRLMKLPAIPQRIECFDVSNLQGTSVVASNVCFIDGKPAKELYRAYNIKSLAEGQQDDFASITEVIDRRLRRAREEQDLPDLIIIDGGRGQLNAALKAAANYPDLQLRFAGLAKSRTERASYNEAANAPTHTYERIILPGEDTAIPLKPGSPEFRLLTRLRDEAHRFAITHHRRKRAKKFMESPLDTIPGIGKVLKRKLLAHFGSVDVIKTATVEDLAKVDGISEATAVNIYTHFRSNTGTS